MAQERNEVLIDIKVNADEVARTLNDATQNVARLKDENKKLQEQQKKLSKQMQEEGADVEALSKEMAENTKQMAANNAQIEANNRVIKSNTAMLQMATLANVDENSTLDEKRQLLNAVQKAYGSMTAEQKAAAGGAEQIEKQIKKLSDAVKAQEAAIGDNRRNVGNYTESIIEAANKMGGFGSSIVGIMSPMKAATGAMKAMAATPLIAIISLAVNILMKLHERFKGNAAAMEKLNEIFGVFAGIGNIVNIIIDKIAEGVGWLAEKVLELADKMGMLSKSMKEGQAIAKEDMAIQKAQREAALKTAEDQKKIAELKAAAAETDKHTSKERLDLLQQAANLEEGIAKRQYELAKREYELQVRKNNQSASSQEDMKKENELRIAMINAETALFNKQKELNGQMAGLRQQEAAKAKAAAQESIKEAEAAAAKLAEIRDEMLRRTRSQLDNEIADLEAKRDKELEIAGLTAEEKIAIEQYYAGKIKELRDADLLAVQEQEKAKLQARADARVEFGLDPEKTPEEQELERLQEARAQELLNEEEYQEARKLIIERYAEEREEVAKKERENITAQYKAELKTAVASAAGASMALANAMGEFAEESEAAAKAQKAFTLIGIITNQAQSISEGALAIAKGVESAAGLPFPANIPAIISITAQVGAMIAGVMTSIAQAKQLFSTASAQKFATGGIVGGTSYTGDHVPIMANSREMVLTTQQQTRLFDALDGGSGGNLGINYEALAAAVSALPAPVMALKELADEQDKVATFDEIAGV